MNVRWSSAALADLERHHAWLSTLPHAKPAAVIARIRSAAESMERLGDIGRPSRAEGARELSVRIDPYVIAYRVDGETIAVLAVYHTAADRRD